MDFKWFTSTVCLLLASSSVALHDDPIHFNNVGSHQYDVSYVDFSPSGDLGDQLNYYNEVDPKRNGNAPIQFEPAPTLAYRPIVNKPVPIAPNNYYPPPTPPSLPPYIPQSFYPDARGLDILQQNVSDKTVFPQEPPAPRIQTRPAVSIIPKYTPLAVSNRYVALLAQHSHNSALIASPALSYSEYTTRAPSIVLNQRSPLNRHQLLPYFQNRVTRRVVPVPFSNIQNYYQ